MDPSTGNLDKSTVSTIEVVDFKVSTEVQAICPQCADLANKESIDVGHRDEMSTDSPGHFTAIKQRVADGHVVIKGHHSQDIYFHVDKGCEEVTLHQTPPHRKWFLFDSKFSSIFRVTLEENHTSTKDK